jgi:hypothetical protein
MTATEELANNRMMIFHGQTLAFEKMEAAIKWAQSAHEWVKRTDEERGDLSRVVEVNRGLITLGLMLDEIAILKREAREAHAEEMSR